MKIREGQFKIRGPCRIAPHVVPLTMNKPEPIQIDFVSDLLQNEKAYSSNDSYSQVYPFGISFQSDDPQQRLKN